MFKICCRCKIEKSITLFNKNKYSKDGYRCECRDCQKSNNSKSINKNRIGEKILCKICNNTKLETFFKKDNNYVCGYGNICKECIKNKNGVKSKNIKYFNKGIIYILESNGIYKIGLTKRDIKHRINDFKVGNPYKINILKQYKSDYINYDENYLHKYFTNKHFRGEWFNLNNFDLLFIDNYFNNLL